MRMLWKRTYPPVLTRLKSHVNAAAVTIVATMVIAAVTPAFRRSSRNELRTSGVRCKSLDSPIK